MFAMEETHNKKEILQLKANLGYDVNIMAWDIIPIVRQAWEKSFEVVESNKEALAKRG